LTPRERGERERKRERGRGRLYPETQHFFPGAGALAEVDGDLEHNATPLAELGAPHLQIPSPQQR
jgi:hypothetical protein